MLHEYRNEDELFSVVNSITSISSRPTHNQDNLNNNNNDEYEFVNESNNSKFSKFTDFIDKHFYKVILMIIIVLNATTSLVGFYYHGECKLKFVPSYLITFGIISVILIIIYIFFPDDKTSAKFDFYYKYTLMEIKKMPEEDQNRLKEALVPLKIQKKKIDDFKRMQTTLINVLTKILEGVLAVLVLYTFINFYEKESFVQLEDPTKENYCDKNLYNFTQYHLVFICASFISLILVSVFYLTGYFLFSNDNKY